MRPRYGRRSASSSGKNEGLAAVAGHRHGKYLATCIRETAFDLSSISRTSTKVFALEVMGRHAG